MKFVIYISLLARLVFVLLVIFFIKEKNDNVYFLFFYGIGNLLAGIFSALVGYRVLQLQTVMPTFSNVLAELKKGWHTWGYTTWKYTPSTCLAAKIIRSATL